MRLEKLKKSEICEKTENSGNLSKTAWNNFANVANEEKKLKSVLNGGSLTGGTLTNF